MRGRAVREIVEHGTRRVPALVADGRPMLERPGTMHAVLLRVGCRRALRIVPGVRAVVQGNAMAGVSVLLVIPDMTGVLDAALVNGRSVLARRMRGRRAWRRTGREIRSREQPDDMPRRTRSCATQPRENVGSALHDPTSRL